MKFLLLCLSFCSCATVKRGELHELNPSKVSLDSESISIEIIDNRALHDGEHNINIPVISFPWDSIMHHRRFSDNTLKDVFKNEILPSYFGGSSKVQVRILKSIQYFYTTSFKEAVSVVAKLLIRRERSGQVCEGVREIRGTVESLDASVDYINTMLIEALRKSFNLALRSCKF